MNRELDSYILSINTGAEAYATNTWMGFEPASMDQVHRLRIVFDEVLEIQLGRRPHRSERIGMLQRIFPYSQLPDPLTLQPRRIESTKDLSKAQACALIDAIFGHPVKGLTPASRPTADGEWFVLELYHRLNQAMLAYQDQLGLYTGINFLTVA
jgi:hypothetical protein